MPRNITATTAALATAELATGTTITRAVQQGVGLNLTGLRDVAGEDFYTTLMEQYNLGDAWVPNLNVQATMRTVEAPAPRRRTARIDNPYTVTYNNPCAEVGLGYPQQMRQAPAVEAPAVATTVADAAGNTVAEYTAHENMDRLRGYTNGGVIEPGNGYYRYAYPPTQIRIDDGDAGVVRATRDNRIRIEPAWGDYGIPVWGNLYPGELKSAKMVKIKFDDSSIAIAKNRLSCGISKCATFRNTGGTIVPKPGTTDTVIHNPGNGAQRFYAVPEYKYSDLTKDGWTTEIVAKKEVVR